MPTIEELAAEVGSLRRRVDAAEAVLEIQALKARYRDLVDQRFSGGDLVDDGVLARVVDEVVTLFTPDAVWDGGPGLGSVTGRAAIAARLRQPTLTFSRHLFVKPRIQVDGDQARARWDLLSPCRRPDGSSYWMCGYEDDEYLRVDGVWLHRSMKLTTVFMSPVGQGWTTILAQLPVLHAAVRAAVKPESSRDREVHDPTLAHWEYTSAVTRSESESDHEHRALVHVAGTSPAAG
jgi:hypothetical protein